MFFRSEKWGGAKETIYREKTGDKADPFFDNMISLRLCPQAWDKFMSHRQRMLTKSQAYL